MNYVCKAGPEPPDVIPFELWVTQQGSERDCTEIPSDATVDQLVEQEVDRRELMGLWKLRFQGETLQGETTLADAGVAAEVTVDLVPAESVGRATMEEKEPIFKVTLESTDQDQSEQVIQTHLLVQYVRQGQMFGQPIKRETISGEDDLDSSQLVQFRILGQSPDGGRFAKFNQRHPCWSFLADKTRRQTSWRRDQPGYAELSRLISESGSLYLQLSGRDLPLHVNLPLEKGDGLSRRPGLTDLTQVSFDDVVSGSHAVGTIKEMPIITHVDPTAVGAPYGQVYRDSSKPAWRRLAKLLGAKLPQCLRRQADGGFSECEK